MHRITDYTTPVREGMTRTSGHWCTLTSDEGIDTHIYVGGQGLVTKGPAALIGSNIAHLPPAPRRTAHPVGSVPAGHDQHPTYTEHASTKTAPRPASDDKGAPGKGKPYARLSSDDDAPKNPAAVPDGPTPLSADQTQAALRTAEHQTHSATHDAIDAQGDALAIEKSLNRHIAAATSTLSSPDALSDADGIRDRLHRLQIAGHRLDLFPGGRGSYHVHPKTDAAVPDLTGALTKDHARALSDALRQKGIDAQPSYSTKLGTSMSPVSGHYVEATSQVGDGPATSSKLITHEDARRFVAAHDRRVVAPPTAPTSAAVPPRPFTDREIDALKTLGSEWHTGDKHRVYFHNLQDLYGLQSERYGSGHMASATLDGEPVSNTKARRIADDLHEGKIWYDLGDASFHTSGLSDHYRHHLTKAVRAYVHAQTPHPFVAPIAARS